MKNIVEEPKIISETAVLYSTWNDNLAKDIFIKYYKENIKELEEKINGYFRKIRIVKGEVYQKNN